MKNNKPEENRLDVERTRTWFTYLRDMVKESKAKHLYVSEYDKVHVDLDVPQFDPNEKQPSRASSTGQLPEYAVQTSTGRVIWLPRDKASLVLRLSLFEIPTGRLLPYFTAIPVYAKGSWKERYRGDTLKCASHLKHFDDEDKQLNGAVERDERVRRFNMSGKSVYALGEYGEMLVDMAHAAQPFLALLCVNVKIGKEAGMVEGLNRDRPYYMDGGHSITPPGSTTAHLKLNDNEVARGALLGLARRLVARYSWHKSKGHPPVFAPFLNETRVSCERRTGGRAGNPPSKRCESRVG